MTTFAFDIQLAAVARVTAPDEATARRFMKEALDCLDLARTVQGGACTLTLTESSLDGTPALFEVNDKPADVHAAFVARKAAENARYEATCAAASLSADEMNALRAFKARHGRTWKAKLLDMWQSGRDANEPVLRVLRNRLGPSGLARVKL
jgi:hypothetical protein